MKKKLTVRQKIFILVFSVLMVIYDNYVQDTQEIFLIHIFMIAFGILLYNIMHSNEKDITAKFLSIASVLVVATYLILIACSVLGNWYYALWAILTIIFGYILYYTGD